MIKLINLYVNSLNDMENISKPIYLAFNIKQSYIFRWNISIYYLLNKYVHVSSLTFSIIDICTFVHKYSNIQNAHFQSYSIYNEFESGYIINFIEVIGQLSTTGVFIFLQKQHVLWLLKCSTNNIYHGCIKMISSFLYKNKIT